MTVRRLHVSSLPKEGGVVSLGEASSRHVRVLRLRVGAEVVLFDGDGNASNARIEFIDREHIHCRAEEPVATEPKQTRVVLMLAVPKGSKVDDCIRTATELGANEVALMQTERTVPRRDPQRTEARIARLIRVASEAAAQCERSDMPLIHAPESCEGLLKKMPAHARGVLFGARADGALDVFASGPEQVWCAVGPEGGFTEGELALFQEAGFVVASLGERILRVETAVAAALALVQDRLEAGRQAR